MAQWGRGGSGPARVGDDQRMMTTGTCLSFDIACLWFASSGSGVPRTSDDETVLLDETQYSAVAKESGEESAGKERGVEGAAEVVESERGKAPKDTNGPNEKGSERPRESDATDPGLTAILERATALLTEIGLDDDKSLKVLGLIFEAFGLRSGSMSQKARAAPNPVSPQWPHKKSTDRPRRKGRMRQKKSRSRGRPSSQRVLPRALRQQRERGPPRHKILRCEVVQRALKRHLLAEHPLLRPNGVGSP
ncbi:hypothetical protein AVEN_84214-1 [Araneus ventricosus]|uniref:Uncharacterized protein n=1 Tax=Araneus ventricosus TaxID=182803 RepID=A0A4Y2L1B0_ARAVE|nr:hypothetical protein AVEN_84214-1 [Araneus ventricosus]